jgi:hypothetical protein
MSKPCDMGSAHLRRGTVTGEISVKPELLQQVIPTETATMQPNGPR